MTSLKNINNWRTPGHSAQLGFSSYPGLETSQSLPEPLLGYDFGKCPGGDRPFESPDFPPTLDGSLEGWGGTSQTCFPFQFFYCLSKMLHHSVLKCPNMKSVLLHFLFIATSLNT